jgi:sarcosine oxidase subunit gamma
MVDRALPKFAATRWLARLPPAGRWVLHGDEHVRALAMPKWGVPFSAAACRAVVSGSRATLWLGPDEFLLLELDDDGDPLRMDSLEAALDGVPHALVDVSHRQFALEIKGPHVTEILNGACPLDLDMGQFPVGMCTRTVFGKADVLLWRTQEDTFHMEIWRSFADYVVGTLTEIGREFE